MHIKENICFLNYINRKKDKYYGVTLTVLYIILRTSGGDECKRGH